ITHSDRAIPVIILSTLTTGFLASITVPPVVIRSDRLRRALLCFLGGVGGHTANRTLYHADINYRPLSYVRIKVARFVLQPNNLKARAAPSSNGRTLLTRLEQLSIIALPALRLLSGSERQPRGERINQGRLKCPKKFP